MSAGGRSLISRLRDLVRTPGFGESAPSDAVLGVSEAAGRKLSRAEAMLRYSQKLIGDLEARMLLVRAAVQGAGLLPPAPISLAPAARAKLPGLVAFLRADRQAASACASVLIRYEEAKAEAKQLEQALGQGNVGAIDLDRSRGRFFYLVQLPHTFRDCPPLAPLFGPPPSRATIQRTPTRSIGAPKPGPAKPPSELERTVRQAKDLLAFLEVKMLIVQAALDRHLAEDARTKALLPAPALQTAGAIGAVVAADPALMHRLRQAVGAYREARALLARPTPDRIGQIQAVLSHLSSLPLHVRHNALLSKLFPVA